MARQHQRPLYARAFEKGVKILAHVRSRPRRWAGRAPAISRAIVRAHARDLAQRRLHVLPRYGAQPESGVEDDGGRSLSGAVDVKNASADIDQSAGWCVATVGHTAREQLIDRTDEKHEDDERDESNNTASDDPKHAARARHADTGRHRRSCAHFAEQEKLDASFVSPDPL